MADLHLPVVDDNGSPITIVIPNIFYDLSWEINLISSNDANKTDWDVNFSANDARSGLYHYTAGEDSPTARVAIGLCGKLSTFHLAGVSNVHDFNEPTSFLANCGSMSVEELFHLCMAHAPISCLVNLTGK
eukprot:1530287-Rhodomonas_salina.1